MRRNIAYRSEGVMSDTSALDETPGRFPLAPYAGDVNYKGAIINKFGEKIGDDDSIEIEPPDSFGGFEDEGGFGAEQAVASAQQNFQTSISDFMAILKNFLSNPKVLLAGAAIGGYLAYKKGYLEKFIK